MLSLVIIIITGLKADVEAIVISSPITISSWRDKGEMVDITLYDILIFTGTVRTCTCPYARVGASPIHYNIYPLFTCSNRLSKKIGTCVRVGKKRDVSQSCIHGMIYDTIGIYKIQELLLYCPRSLDQPLYRLYQASVINKHAGSKTEKLFLEDNVP